MNKRTKKFITGIMIFTSTLTAGFLITMLSFNLFDALTPTQMKILFTADVICLVVTGAAVYLADERKKKKRKEDVLNFKRNEGYTNRNAEFEKLMSEINYSNFAA